MRTLVALAPLGRAPCPGGIGHTAEPDRSSNDDGPHSGRPDGNTGIRVEYVGAGIGDSVLANGERFDLTCGARAIRPSDSGSSRSSHPRSDEPSMTDDLLAELLTRNAAHARSLPRDHFDAVIEGQDPAVVSVCCADSRVPQAGMWGVTEPGWLFTPSVIGNQTWDVVDGDRVVEGSLIYPLVTASTRVVAVVGHTQCGAVTAAYDRVRGEGSVLPRGAEKWIDLLVPVVETGLQSEHLATDRDRAAVIDQLVEYNVRRQVQFVADATDVPDDTSVFGFVYDFTGRYAGDRGRAYLVSVNGETDPAVLRHRVPPDSESAVKTLLQS